MIFDLSRCEFEDRSTTDLGQDTDSILVLRLADESGLVNLPDITAAFLCNMKVTYLYGVYEWPFDTDGFLENHITSAAPMRKPFRYVVANPVRPSAPTDSRRLELERLTLLTEVVFVLCGEATSSEINTGTLVPRLESLCIHMHQAKQTEKSPEQTFTVQALRTGSRMTALSQNALRQYIAPRTDLAVPSSELT